ncbi:dihydrofolate reductase [Invertebrate iridovirus 25]|uniref:dihydrofolate reductase n=1 Tax=Invertebrate iridovirus 25 TaxID=1301280 RepID=W8W233_9VIRU|nr:dihydrofolate reductase [Invertebrate iridovirus 25]CCV02131.1 dihydrofolate reductase [Invertebrate iridovirus 25]
MIVNGIIAISQDGGIGINNHLPWKLQEELKHFQEVTTCTQDKTKKNAVIMGRKTWDSIPDKFKPLKNRVNIIVSNTLTFSTLNNTWIHSNLQNAIKFLNSQQNIETVWIIGGISIYLEALKLNLLDFMYVTEIYKKYECDTFFNIKVLKNFNELKELTSEIKWENKVSYQYKIYKNMKTYGHDITCSLGV